MAVNRKQTHTQTCTYLVDGSEHSEKSKSKTQKRAKGSHKETTTTTVRGKKAY